MKKNIRILEKAKVEYFWAWFESISDNLAEKFENSLLIDELDKRVTDLDDLTWELGPGEFKSNMLVISPGGDIAKLPSTEYIVSMAPGLKKWEFYPAKPAKNNKFTFFYGENQIRIVAENWKYYLERLEDGFLGITLIAEDILKLSSDDQQSIVEILLDQVLGEKRRITTFQYIDVNNFENLDLAKLTSILYLKDHLISLLKD